MTKTKIEAAAKRCRAAFAKQFKKISEVLPMHYELHPETREQFIKLAIQEGLKTENLKT